MKTIKQQYVINAPLAKVWQAFVDPQIIKEWSGESAKMDRKAGTEFELWGGDIHGKNLEVLPKKKLIQEWFGGNWDKPSIVTFTFSHNHQGTQVLLEHIDVPDREEPDIDEGWKQYYLGAIKDFLESSK